MVKIISYWNNLPGDVPGPLWSEISKLRLDAFQKKVLWLSCHSLGFVQEHEIPWPVLDMRSDQLKGGQFLYAAPRPMFCSLGHHSVVFAMLHLTERSWYGLWHTHQCPPYRCCADQSASPPLGRAPPQLPVHYLRVNDHRDPFWPLAPCEPHKEKRTKETLPSHPPGRPQTEMSICSSKNGGGERGLWWARSICQEPSRVSWPTSAQVALIKKVSGMQQWQPR